MADLTPEQFAAALLRRLGIHQTPGAIQALTGWQRAEGGHWHNDARYNPLNTTQNMPGSGDTGSQGNISAYRNWNQGVEATAKTLTNGRYGGIINALRQGSPQAVASAIDRSPWGTHGALVRNAIMSAPRVAGVRAPSGLGGGGGGGGSSPSQPSTRTVQTTTPGVDNSQARGALVRSFLDDKHADVLDFALQARELKDIAPTTTTRTVAAGAPGATGASPQDRGANAGGGAASALSWAESKLGAPGSAESGGPNQGKLAGYLNQRFGMSGQPWCAMFTSAAVTKGGAPPEARTASVAQVRSKAQSGQGYVRGFIPPQHARPGDLVLFGNSHIAMVKSVSGGKIHYVGGNQSNTVSEGTTGGGGVTIVRPKYGAR